MEARKSNCSDATNEYPFGFGTVNRLEQNPANWSYADTSAWVNWSKQAFLLIWGDVGPQKTMMEGPEFGECTLKAPRNWSTCLEPVLPRILRTLEASLSFERVGAPLQKGGLVPVLKGFWNQGSGLSAPGFEACPFGQTLVGNLTAWKMKNWQHENLPP